MNEEETEILNDIIISFDQYSTDWTKAACERNAKVILKLQSQLDKTNEKIEKIKEYITSYESISIIQGLDNIENNKSLDNKTMIEMTNRYLEVHDKILSIIGDDK